MDRQCASAWPDRLVLIRAVATPTFGPVQHHQGDSVPPLKPAALGPVAEAVGHGVEFAIGDGPPVIRDGDAVREPIDGLFPVITDQSRAIQFDRLDAFEQPAQALGETHVALDVRHETHRRPHSAESRPCLGDGQAAGPGQPAGESQGRLRPIERAFAGMRGADAAVTQGEPAEV